MFGSRRSFAARRGDLPSTTVTIEFFCDERGATCDERVTYSHIPSRPPSRPNPLSRYPPNPAAASNRFVELIHTTPALIFGAMSSARLMLSVHTLAARP